MWACFSFQRYCVFNRMPAASLAWRKNYPWNQLWASSIQSPALKKYTMSNSILWVRLYYSWTYLYYLFCALRLWKCSFCLDFNFRSTFGLLLLLFTFALFLFVFWRKRAGNPNRNHHSLNCAENSKETMVTGKAGLNENELSLRLKNGKDGKEREEEGAEDEGERKESHKDLNRSPENLWGSGSRKGHSEQRWQWQPNQVTDSNVSRSRSKDRGVYKGKPTITASLSGRAQDPSSELKSGQFVCEKGWT